VTAEDCRKLSKQPLSHLQVRSVNNRISPCELSLGESFQCLAFTFSVFARRSVPARYLTTFPVRTMPCGVCMGFDDDIFI